METTRTYKWIIAAVVIGLMVGTEVFATCDIWTETSGVIDPNNSSADVNLPNDLTVGGDLDLTGDGSITGDLTVTGDSNMGGGLVVKAASSELVSCGDFSCSTGWDVGEYSEISSGAWRTGFSDGETTYLEQSVAIEVGKYYTVSYELVECDPVEFSTLTISIGGLTLDEVGYGYGPGTATFQHLKFSNTNDLRFYGVSYAEEEPSFVVDNVSVTEEAFSHADNMEVLGFLTIPVEATTVNPTNPVEGQIVGNTYLNSVKIYIDGAWRTLASW